MNTYVLSFKEIDKTRLMVVGGKGLNLGELSKIEEIKVLKVFVLLLRPIKIPLKTIRRLKLYLKS